MPSVLIVDEAAPAGRGAAEVFADELSSNPFAGQVGNPTLTFAGILTQAGDAAPTLGTLANTTAIAAPTPARTGAGVFTLTFASAILAANKTLVLATVNGDGDAVVQATVTSTTVITLETFVAAAADDYNGTLFVKVEVYPA